MKLGTSRLFPTDIEGMHVQEVTQEKGEKMLEALSGDGVGLADQIMWMVDHGVIVDAKGNAPEDIESAEDVKREMSLRRQGEILDAVLGALKPGKS